MSAVGDTGSDVPRTDVTDAIRRVPVLNPANALTVARIVLVPVFLATLFAEGGHDTGWRTIAFLVFTVAMITDRFDGQIARRYKLITNFGKLMDPIADKALTGAALIGLAILGDVWWWVAIVIVVREIGITLMRFAVIAEGVIPASRGGKLKTLVQGIAIGLYILPLSEAWDVPLAIVMAGALVLTVGTGIDYLLSMRKPARV